MHFGPILTGGSYRRITMAPQSIKVDGDYWLAAVNPGPPASDVYNCSRVDWILP